MATPKVQRQSRPKRQPMSVILASPEKTLYNRYAWVHSRLADRRGKASDHLCVDCGQPAQHWAYNNSGIREVTVTLPGRPRRVYSTDLKQYDPRCVRCHLQMDGAVTRRRNRRDQRQPRAD